MTPRKYGAEDARAHLPELLDEAHRGVPTLITKHGRPYAMLVPVEQARAPKRRVAVFSLAGTGVGLGLSQRTVLKERNTGGGATAYAGL